MERFRRRPSSEDPFSRFERALNGLKSSRKPSQAPSTGTEIDEHAGSVEDIKGPLGLNLLSTVTEPLIDFIFVHGLGGGSRKSWSKSPHPHHYWPKEWLSRDPEFSRVRIHSFGYRADWVERKESVLNIHGFARSLLGEIQCSPEIRRSKTKIVLVGHSMGGIVIKKAYILAREDPALKELAHRIHTLYFLATPHRGSDLAKTLANILKVYYGAKPFVTELDRNSDSIMSINDTFRHFADDVQLWSFYETIPSNLVLGSVIVVDEASATLGYAKERLFPLNADHRAVCKFDQPSDPNYKTLRNAFITTVDSILSEVSQSMSEISKLQHYRLVELTGVAEPPVDELSALEDSRVTGSCEWLTSKHLYASWRTAGSGGRSIFWLTGNAGSGKSILCSHIINDLQEHNLRCCYFFFKHGNATTSTTVGCLRSLAYQMARSNDKVLQRLLEAEQDAPLWEYWDQRTIWRKLFIGCIFKTSDMPPQFWVLDALDECQNFPVLLSLVAKAPSCLRIFLSSRGTPEVERGLSMLGPLVEHYQIQRQDTLGDLGIFVDSKMDSLPAGDDEGRAKLKQRILAKASGSFLWASLVVQELGHAYSEEGAEEVLNEVPADMNELYSRMLENVPKTGHVMKLARSVFMWTLLSLRALTLRELQCVIKLDASQTVYNLEKSVSAICGQLVCVDQSNRVQVIHQTAKAFLLQQDACPGLAMNKQQSHTRITEICLKFLAKDFAKELRSRRMKTIAFAPDAEFTDYACIFFSDHLQKSSPEDSTIWNLLFEFLDSNVQSWIEYLARTANLQHITRTAKNLQTYLMRRVKCPTTVPPQKETLEAWVNDLIRLSAMFRASLAISPSSIHTLIPALCPSDSVISKTYRFRQRGLLVDGLTERTWKECLARIDYPAHQTTAVAHGDRYSAVAVSDGTVFLYYRDMLQANPSLSHGERPKILVFSGEDRYLASSGLRMVKVWDLESRTQVWAFDTAHQALTLLFASDNTALTAATQGNCTITWDLQEGLEEERWQWTDCIHATAGQRKPLQPPNKAMFSPDYTTLAVSYRGLPIYLFDMNTESCIGCCSREVIKPSVGTENHYFVDALVFNPNPEIKVLVVSYGDGAIAVYDLWSTEIRHCIPDIFAHSLACSPDGRSLVTGSSRGTVQIFKFSGVEGDRLSPIYRINTYEDGIRGIAFSSDSLRFIDIRRTQCRIWEPTVLVCDGLYEDSHSELSQPNPLGQRSVGVLGEPPESEITAMCCHPGGDFVFCGKQDGSVAYFETRKATQCGILYQHAANIGITCVTYSNQRSLLITADESSRVLIRKVLVSKAACEVANPVAEIRSEDSVTALLLDLSGTRVLVRGNRSAEVWTTEGDRVGSSIPFNDWDVEHRTTICHPLHAEHFISIGRKDMRIYSWVVAEEMHPFAEGGVQALSLTGTPSSREYFSTVPSGNGFDLSANQQFSHFIVNLLKRSYSSLDSSSPSVALEVWPASSISVSNICSRPSPLPGFQTLAPKVRQIISVIGSLMIFLDTDVWVCSLNIATFTSSGRGAERHFFLLSEWQTSDRGFVVEYVPARREFLVARKHELLVVRKGLDFSEPWSAL